MTTMHAVLYQEAKEGKRTRRGREDEFFRVCPGINFRGSEEPLYLKFKDNSAEQSDLKCALSVVFLLVNQRTASFTAGSTHSL